MQMKRENITFKESMKRQIGVIAIMVASLGLLMWATFPIESKREAISFLGIVGVLGLVTIMLIRKKANQVLCENCDANLYWVIEAAKMHEGKEINFCPVCGEKTNA